MVASVSFSWLRGRGLLCAAHVYAVATLGEEVAEFLRMRITEAAGEAPVQAAGAAMHKALKADTRVLFSGCFPLE